jgi:hypothetical protein
VFIHKRNNIKEYLKGCPDAIKKEVLHDIFSCQDGEVFSSGLVDVENAESFDASLLKLKQRWEKFVPGFHT